MIYNVVDESLLLPLEGMFTGFSFFRSFFLSFWLVGWFAFLVILHKGNKPTSRKWKSQCVRPQELPLLTGSLLCTVHRDVKTYQWFQC